MIADALAIRWESLAMAVGALALAVWAFRSPYQNAPEAAARPLDAVGLTVIRPGRDPETVEIRDGCLLGRGRDCQVVFDDATVSKLHARLRLDGAAATIEDLDSSNGTSLNGRRLEGMAELHRGDRIDLGANQIVYLGAMPSGDA